MKKVKQINTSLIIGRWQPWHDGHRELFKAALSRAERVLIGVRDTHLLDDKNPFTFEQVKEEIDRDLKDEFLDKYEIISFPNITNVIYGRDVGYKIEEVSFSDEIEKISATDIRKKLNINPELHDVSEVERVARIGHQGGVMWFTGLSGSGKSTLARSLERNLFNKGYSVYMLDGDNLRDGLNSNLSFSSEDRHENIRRAAEVALLMSEIGYIVLAAFITPKKKDRNLAKKILGKKYYEIYLSADLEACEKRDPKGLYKKARRGEIKNFTGIDSLYEVPDKADLVLNTSKKSITESLKVLNKIIYERFELIK